MYTYSVLLNVTVSASRNMFTFIDRRGKITSFTVNSKALLTVGESLLEQESAN